MKITFRLHPGMLNMTQLLACVFLIHSLALSSQALAADIRPDSPSRYEVVDGDTLWDISGMFLQDPWLWPEVWQDNPQIENPHLIYPGDIIILSYENGSPILSLQRSTDLPVVRLTPRVRREVLTSPIPAIPLDAIASFLDSDRIIGSTELDNANRFLGTQKGVLMASSGDVILARGTWPRGVSRYEIVRQGEVYYHPETEQEIGVKADLIAEAVLLTQDGDQATLLIESNKQEVRSGDKIITRESNVIDSSYFPQPPNFAVSAQILEIGNGLAFGGNNDTLVLDIGSRDNIEIGHLLSAQKPEVLVDDAVTQETLSFAGEKYASILIYKVFENASLGLVLNSRGPIRMNDRVVTP